MHRVGTVKLTKIDFGLNFVQTLIIDLKIWTNEILNFRWHKLFVYKIHLDIIIHCEKIHFEYLSRI